MVILAGAVFFASSLHGPIGGLIHTLSYSINLHDLYNYKNLHCDEKARKIEEDLIA